MYTTTVNTSGTAVTATSGSAFPTDGSWTNATITIANVQYTIASVGSTTALTLNSSAGSQTGATLIAGLIQTNDTGQAVFTATVLTFTQVTMTGTSASVAYSSYTGPAPRAGMSVIVTGFATSSGANNGTFTLTAVSGGLSGTVTWTNASGVNETHAGSGTTTAMTSGTYPSGTSTYVYEVYGLADALQATSPFYLKIEYGTGTTVNDPVVYVTISTAQTTAGVFPANSLTSSMGTRTSVSGNLAIGNSATRYECDLSGNVDRLGCILWRNSTGSLTRIFAFDRSKNSSGGNTGTYLTLITAGGGTTQFSTQQTVFSPNGSMGYFTTQETSSPSRWGTILPITATSGTVTVSSVANTLVSPIYPFVGYVDNPHLMAVVGLAADWLEGNNPAPTVYGATHTYLFTKSTGIGLVGNQGVGNPAIRWE